MKSALFIGRFQPFHRGHLSVIKKILKDNDRIIIVIGSAEKNFIPKNPMTAAERFQLIEESLKEAKIHPDKYVIIPVRDVNNYAVWVNHVNTYVPPYESLYTGSELVKACYKGKYFHSSEGSADNKKNGPKIFSIDRKFKISATIIRQAIINDDKQWKNMVPPVVVKLMDKWGIPRRLKTIRDEGDETPLNHSC